MRAINKLVIHCSATPPSMDIGAKEIREWHVRDNGWADIGYHFVIRRDGTVETGRPLEKQGAHAAAKNGNVASIGVCMVGGVRKQGGRLVTENNFAPAQWTALDALVKRLMKQFPIDTLLGHRDLDPRKDCPSFSVKDAAAQRGWMKARTWV